MLDQWLTTFCTAEVRFQEEAELFFSPPRPDRLLDSSSLALLRGIKRPEYEAERSAQSSAGLENLEIYLNSAFHKPPYACV
jgi:hypothetical protein